MPDKPADSWRARAAVSEALDFFNSGYMQDVWTKALARRDSDPEGAVTSARTLLESVCKHILDASGKPYPVGRPLPELYRLTREVLDLAPNPSTAAIFNNLFTACTEIIENVGKLRNHLSDSHGRGQFGTMPDWRHAELAVNLSGAMAMYLAAVWKGREPTVADAIERYLEHRSKTNPLNESQVFGLRAVKRTPLGELIASKIKSVDLLDFLEARIRGGNAPQSNLHYFVSLRLVLGEQAPEVFEEVYRIATQRKLISKAPERTRRVSDEELAELVRYFQKPVERGKPRTIKMDEIIQFSAWSGRKLGEISELRWSDVDFKKRTCKVYGINKTFPVLEKAWDIIEARKSARSADDDDRIFPFDKKSMSASATLARKRLETTMPGLANFRLNDLRFEAVNRLLEKGHPPHEVASASGMPLPKVAKIHRQLQEIGQGYVANA